MTTITSDSGHSRLPHHHQGGHEDSSRGAFEDSEGARRVVPNSNKSSMEDGHDEEGKIASKEERRVRLTKIFVVTVFVLCAIAVSVATYLFTRESENSTFEIEVCRIQMDSTVVPEMCVHHITMAYQRALFCLFTVPRLCL